MCTSARGTQCIVPVPCRLLCFHSPVYLLPELEQHKTQECSFGSQASLPVGQRPKSMTHIGNKLAFINGTIRVGGHTLVPVSLLY
jgi:hypothetical protein